MREDMTQVIPKLYHGHGFKEHDPGLVSTPMGRVRIAPHSITCYCGYEARDKNVRVAYQQMNEHLGVVA